MAIGAVIFSLPMAFLASVLLSVMHGLSTPQGLLLYSMAGFMGMIVFLIVNGLPEKSNLKHI